MGKLSRIAAFLVVLSLSLNEFYSEAVGRIFDYAALLFILVFFSLNYRKVKFKKADFSLFFFFSFYVILGLISLQILPSLAVFFGITFVTLFIKYFNREYSTFLPGIIDSVICIHFVALVIQIVAFYGFNYPFSFVDFFPGLQASRTYNEGLNFMRPGGLMMEPNSYSANMFMMVFMYYKCKGKLSRNAIIGLLTVPFTTSLWGILIFAVILFMYAKPIYKISMLALILISAVFLISFFEDTITVVRIMRILEDPGSDNSIVTRLGLDSDTHVNPINFIIGNGINSTDFQGFMGGNGFSYMFFCFGIVGFCIFVFWFLFSNGFRLLVLFLLFNITFPYFSYLIFWAVLAIGLRGFSFAKVNSVTALRQIVPAISD